MKVSNGRVMLARDVRTLSGIGFDYEKHLPAELAAIKPKWVIPMSPNYSAHIYEVDGWVHAHNEQGGVYKKPGIVYEAHLLHNKSGISHRSVSFSGYTSRREARRFESLHDLRIALDCVAVELRPKTTVRQESEDPDA